MNNFIIKMYKNLFLNNSDLKMLKKTKLYNLQHRDKNWFIKLLLEF